MDDALSRAKAGPHDKALLWRYNQKFVFDLNIILLYVVKVIEFPSLIPSTVLYYCGAIQNIEEWCGGIFSVNIYMKIFEYNVLNNFDKYCFIFFHIYSEIIFI